MSETRTSAAENERAAFFASMSAGLHAMAQPLTILQYAIAAWAAPGVSVVEQQRYLHRSQQQIERACMLFNLLQDLVNASHTEAEFKPLDLVGLLSEIVEDRRAGLRVSGIELKLVAPSKALAWGDAARTRQAILAVVNAFASVSSNGDEILLHLTGDRQVECLVRTELTHGKSLSSGDQLCLAVARANILSQQGDFETGADPFWVRVILPASPSTENGAGP